MLMTDPVEPGVNGEFGHPRCLSLKALCMGDILDINSDGNLIPKRFTLGPF
jgi:hypothetical protein